MPNAVTPNVSAPSSSGVVASRARAAASILAESLPLTLAFFTISFAYGVLAREAGLPWWTSALMSLLVYAGTSQVVALTLIAAGQPIWLIVGVTFMVNARLALLATVIQHRVAHWPAWARWLFAWQVTDESFALLYSRAHHFSVSQALAIQGGSHLAWVGGTLAGHVFGGNVAELQGLGLDFALVAMMLAVLVLLIRDSKTLLVALGSGIAAMVVIISGLEWLSILAAAAVGPLIGVGLERRCRKRS